MYYVYTHRRPDGSAFYVGKGLPGRPEQARGRTMHWRHVVAKHGGFSVVIEGEYELEADAFAAERSLITQMRQSGVKLVNMTDGGEGCSGRDKGKRLSSEHREKLRQAKLGSRQSPATVAKRLAKTRGQKRSTEARARMSMAALARSADYRARLSAAKTGRTYEAHVHAVRAAISRPVVCTPGERLFGAVTDAAKWADCRGANISACCRGRRKSAGGYSWRYADAAADHGI